MGRRRRGRGGQGRAARGRRVPARPEALQVARRQGPEGHPAARPARHRQDAARQGSRATSRTRTFFAQSAASFVEMFVGLGAARIRRLFREARKEAPAIIFIDELDAVGAQARHATLGREGPDAQPAAGRARRLRRRDNVVVIAASNLLEKLDPALLRPGRFDRQIFVSPPDLKGRKEILDVHTRDKPLARTSTSTWSPARRAASPAPTWPTSATRRRSSPAATRRGRSSRADFEPALERVVAGMQSRRVITDHEKRVVAYHEAGHALCSELLPVGREGPPDLDRPARPRARLHAQPARGGPLPEDARGADATTSSSCSAAASPSTLVFGQITTGASDDLQQGARDQPARWSPSTAWARELSSQRCRPTTTRSPTHTRRARDEEQRASPTRRTGARTTLVSSTATLLEKLATTLLENEVLERGDIEAMGMTRRRRSTARAPRPRRAGTERVAAPRAAESDRRPEDAAEYSAAVFGRIDHIGVAVEDIDAALELYSGRASDGSSSTARPSRSRASRRVLLEVGDGHVELLAPLGPETPAVASSSSATARGCTTWPTRPMTSTPTLERIAPPGLTLIDEEPRTGIRGSRVAFLHPKSTGRRADRDRRAGGGTLMADGRRDRRRLRRRRGARCASEDERLRQARSRRWRRHPDRWHTLDHRGLGVLVDLSQVVYVRARERRSKVGF